MVGECLALVMVVYMVFYFLFYKMESDFSSMSPYECGFDPKSGTRVPFSYRFFLISILFLIFDVEISLLLPFPFLVGSGGAAWVLLNFILVLIVGLMYEYYEGSLDWLDVFVSKA